jgi:hypothetical protein
MYKRVGDNDYFIRESNVGDFVPFALRYHNDYFIPFF